MSSLAYLRKLFCNNDYSVSDATGDLTVAFRASGKSFSQKLVTARLMYLIRACGTAHLERRTRKTFDARSRLVVARLIYVIGLRTRGPDTENRILTYYDEPVAARGRAAAPADSRSSAPASGPLSTSGRSRPGDSTTRYDCWCRPPCRCPSPACRTPPTPIWTISICVALDHVLSCTGPRRTAIDSLYGILCERNLKTVWHATLANVMFQIFFCKVRAIASLFDAIRLSIAKH